MIDRPARLSIDGNRRRLRILMLLEGGYPPLQGGGTELQVMTLAQGLRQRGHVVSIVAPLCSRGQARLQRMAGIPVYRIPYPRLRGLGGVVLAARLARFLWRKGERYDAWHAHSPRRTAAIAAWIGSWKVRPRVVVKINSASRLDQGAFATRRTVSARFLRRCLESTDAWQAISNRIARQLVDRGIPRSRVVTVPNAVDPGRFRRRPGIDDAHRRFVFIGRLVPEKGLFDLLDAFAMLVRSHPDASLRIVGAGPLQAALADSARRHGLGAAVEFAGHRDDIDEVLSDADIAVLPSHVEGLSNALLECMAAGLPMVASRVSGSEDMVNDGNGWLFEPGDVRQLAACLARASSVPGPVLRRMGDNARAEVERRAAIGHVLDRLLLVYRGGTSPTPNRDSSAIHRHGADTAEARPCCD